MIWVDGEAGSGVPADDRGLGYGDGLFETMRVLDGAVPLLERHLARLFAGCARLRIEGLDRAALRRELAAACADRADGVIKLVITRGSGARGYRIPTGASPRRIISRHPRTEWPASFAQEGIRARTCSTRLGLGGPLAGLKHLNRLEQVLARSEWQDEDIVEGLMLDAEGCVVAGTMTNLFLVNAGVLQTPSLDRCGVAGVARGLLMERAAALDLRVEERRIAPAALSAAEALFVCNSVVGIWPLRELDGRTCGRSELVARLTDAARAEGLA
jgi:4-amino-4-deoxychorismate lyase